MPQIHQSLTIYAHVHAKGSDIESCHIFNKILKLHVHVHVLVHNFKCATNSTTSLKYMNIYMTLVETFKESTN